MSGQLIVTVYEVIGIYSSSASTPETYCMVHLADRAPVRTKPVKVSERATSPRPGVEVKLPDVDERSYKFRIGVWKQGSPEPTFLGHVKLELSSLSPGKSEEQTLKIKKSKGKGFAKGGLHFGYEYRPAVNFDEKKRKDALGFGDKFRGFSILTGPKKHKRVFAQPPDPQRAEVPAPLQCPLTALEQRGYHTTEGIFRISAPASEVEALKELYESGKEVNWTSYDAHVLAGVIINYLLNLPEPLTSFELYDSLISAYETGEDLNVKKAFMRKLLATLPPGFKICVETLMTYLAKVASFTAENKMTSKNLGIVFGPALLRRRTETPQQIIRDSPIVIEIVTLMVDNVPAFFKGQELPAITGGSGDVVMEDTHARPPQGPSPRRNTGGAGTAPQAIIHPASSAASNRDNTMLASSYNAAFTSSGPLAAPSWARTQDRRTALAAAGATPPGKPTFLQLGKTGIRGTSPQKQPPSAGSSNNAAQQPSAAATVPIVNIEPLTAADAAAIARKDEDDALMQVETLLRSKEAETKPETNPALISQSLGGSNISSSQRLSMSSKRGSRSRLEWSRLNQTRNRLTQRINSFGHLEAAALALMVEQSKSEPVVAGATADPDTPPLPTASAARPPAELGASMLLPVTEVQEAVAEDVSFSRKNTNQQGSPRSASPQFAAEGVDVPPKPSSRSNAVEAKPNSGKGMELNSSTRSEVKAPEVMDVPPKPSSGKGLELKPSEKTSSREELKESREKPRVRDEPPMPFPLRVQPKGGSGISSRSSKSGAPPMPSAPLPEVYSFLVTGASAEPHSITTSGRKPVDAVKATESASRRSDPPLPLHSDAEMPVVNVAQLPPAPALPPELSQTFSRARALSAADKEEKRLSNPPLPSGAKLPQPIDSNRKRTDSRGTSPKDLPPPPRVATPPHNRRNVTDEASGEQPSITMLRGPTVPGRAGSPLPSVLPSGSIRVGQVGAPGKTAVKGSRDSVDAPPRAGRPLAPEGSGPLSPLDRRHMGPPPLPPHQPPPPPPPLPTSPVPSADDLLEKMRTIIAVSVQEIIDTTATITSRIADGTFYDVISCSVMLKNLKRLLDDPTAGEDLQSMLLDHSRPHPPRPNLRDPSTAKRFNQFCSIAGVTLSELVTNLSQMSKELDSDMLVMERSEVLASAASLARLVRDVRVVLDNFVSYTMSNMSPQSQRSSSLHPAQRTAICKEIEQQGDLILNSINAELARLASVEEAVAFTKLVKNARQLLADRNPQQSLFLDHVVKPALRQSTGSALEATRLETTVDIARYSVSAVATEVSRLINDARATEDLQELNGLSSFIKNIELYIREYIESVAVEEQESTSPRQRPVIELPDEDDEQLALLQRTALSVLSSIQQDLTQLRMELEAHGSEANYEGRVLQIAKIASLIKKLMEGIPLPAEWRQIIDGTPFPQLKQDLQSLVRLSVSLFDQARGWLFEQRQELSRADLPTAIGMAQGLSQVAKVAEWYRRQYATP